MSQPTGIPVSGEHPDHDLLADLAAEVLPDELAYRVQDHVMACDYCAWLLAEAEGIRSLLLQVPAEPMPAPVLDRLERALLAARQEDQHPVGLGHSAERSDDGQTDLGQTDIGSTGARRGRSTSSGGTRRITRAAPATTATTRISTSAAATVGAAGGPGTSRLSRMSRPSSSARRQAVQEQRAERPSRLLPALKIAASVLVVAGVGLIGVKVFAAVSDGSADLAASGAESAAASPPVLAQVQSTGTKYTKADLSKQVTKLIADSSRSAGTEEQPLLDSQQEATPQASTATGGAEKSRPTTPAAGQQLLRSPEALRACLETIGAGTLQPVAVDLARYAGREAAIIVLPADGGGYDVWAVARDCRPGSDGTLDVVSIKP